MRQAVPFLTSPAGLGILEQGRVLPSCFAPADRGVQPPASERTLIPSLRRWCPSRLSRAPVETPGWRCVIETPLVIVCCASTVWLSVQLLAIACLRTVPRTWTTPVLEAHSDTKGGVTHTCSAMLAYLSVAACIIQHLSMLGLSIALHLCFLLEQAGGKQHSPSQIGAFVLMKMKETAGGF